MRNRLIPMIALAACTACEKDLADAPEGFDVRAAATYRAGEPVEFRLTGRADHIVFFSGEPGKEYANRDRASTAGTAKLIFQVAMQQGPVSPELSNDSLRLLVSTDLDGYDADAIRRAQWTDITDRNTRWPAEPGTTFTTSDSVDLSDFADADRVSIAFRAIGKPHPDYPQRKWQIQNVSLGNRLADGRNFPLMASFASAGWVQASLANDTAPGTPENGYVGYNAWNVGTWNISTADSVRNSQGIPIRTTYPLTFDPGPSLDNPANDDWLIASAVDLKTCQPDVGAVIKNQTAKTLETYSYVFGKPGTYRVVFLASNGSLKGDVATAIRELTLTITP